MEWNVRKAFLGALGLTIGALLAGSGAPAAAGSSSCLQIEDVTAFAPRGEIYVEVRANCRDEDFVDDEAILVYLELMVGERPPVTHDLRFEPTEPRRRETVLFEDRDIAPGDPILVRLIRSGRVLGLRTITTE